MPMLMHSDKVNDFIRRKFKDGVCCVWVQVTDLDDATERMDSFKKTDCPGDYFYFSQAISYDKKTKWLGILFYACAWEEEERKGQPQSVIGVYLKREYFSARPIIRELVIKVMGEGVEVVFKSLN
jgi:hypothetical protein